MGLGATIFTSDSKGGTFQRSRLGQPFAGMLARDTKRRAGRADSSKGVGGSLLTALLRIDRLRED
jgi:hypothetical protein